MPLVSASMAMFGNGNIARAADAERALASGAATGVGYTIEREQIPEVIADFQRALMSLEDAAKEAQGHENLVPPGGDPYSTRAIKAMGPELVNNYMASNKRDAENVEAMIDNLEAAMRQYDAQEDEADRSFRPEA